MKKTAIIILSALLVCDCQLRQAEELPLPQQEEPQTAVMGRVGSAVSRTSLDADGRIVLWSAGDSIGLFGSTMASRNIGAKLQDSYAGSEDGLFLSSISVEPLYAYYPFAAGASNTRNSVNLSLPSTQNPKNGQPDMRYDLKVASSVTGTRQAGFSAVFVQKLALLHFVLTPDSQLAGDRILNISLRDTSSALSGEYALQLDDAAAPLSFTSPSDRATFLFEGSPVLAEGVPVEGWLFVNPDVKKGDALEIKIRTSAHYASVKVTASKDYEAGYRYRMPLDMAYLASKGKVTVTDTGDDEDIKTLDKAGVYDVASRAYKCGYVPQTCQYATYSTEGKLHFRILSFPEGWALEFVVPSGLEVGADCEVVVTATGDAAFPSGKYHAEVLKISDSMIWLSCPDDGIGIILIKE